MNKEQLKERARTFVEIPENFQPILEEYFEWGNGKGEAVFTWTDELQDEGISITLDLAGNLTSLSIERDNTETNQIPRNDNELKQLAEQFLSCHHPQALQRLTHYETKKLSTGVYRFYYEQIVMDLPLPHAGCFIDVEPGGEIVNFKYYGIQPEPNVPSKLINKEKLIEHVQSRLDFQLTLTNLNASIHDVAEDGLRLMYDIGLFMRYKADVMNPTLTVIHEEDEEYPGKFVSLSPPPEPIEKELSIEELIGITEKMEVIREADLGDEKGIVWREKEWKMKEADLSMDSFLQRHNEDTVKAFISKKTGKVRGFMWFKKRSGGLCLNREECYYKAIEFLQKMVPNYERYLQLIVHNDEDGELDEPKLTEAFTFRVHNGQGIEVRLELVVVAVNRQTGQIDYYSGPRFDFEELKSIPSEPAIPQKEAHMIFLKSLDFELAWNKDQEGSEGYTLVYQACDRHKRKAIRFIDAMTGTVITEKE
ncbi:YcdB/YcdC domain-containing protein [Ureibacillus sinduriensis]|uniref:YcdB/YcdC repeated domain-containing protein n=1 Tax=Ureibacillus sinduriensis BLB-1 = JCM 15800 TaxID=1384057 RepID=A0A0A3HWW5_9BACL|nr:YcdB/YcdC domain-containing protein [Ureibacillus sinduriensis]KGR77106.1 hypothetical protein CD33_04170 [Ureibacillus sinduriensis BLB-1 = JCM 15800]